jgi:hypothetical protein
MIERKSFLSEEVLIKHANDNIQMLYQSILQIGLHKRKSKNVFFFSNLQMI